jgi:Ca2+-transporting ATPase
MQNHSGLSESEAAARLLQVGYNELPSTKPRNILQIGFEVLREPMLLLLLGCAGTYFLLGDVKEALILSIFVFVVIGIELYQERKTERALDALRDLSSPRALVIRDGQRKRIAGREVVPGDLMVLVEGDRVPADGVVLSATNLSADESLLTGESVPVRKSAEEVEAGMRRPGGDDLPFVFSGTLIVHGTALARAEATGLQTELGTIGKSLQEVEPTPTLLKQDTARIVRNLAIAGLTLCALLVIGYGLTRGDWLRGFLAALALAMAILPEELPVVLTVFLALGAWRLSRLNVLTRNMPAVETLGATTALCVDKTGTLTMNRMAVSKLFVAGELLDLAASPQAAFPERFHELLEYAVLASQIEAFDPMDRAIRATADRNLSGTEHIHKNWSLVRQYPLSKQLLAISQVWTSPDGEDFVIAAKGAPEAIIDLCHLPVDEAQQITGVVSDLSQDGLRVLGVAKSRFHKADLPVDQHEFVFDFLGLIALADPVRPTVAKAMRECQQAGIRVVMITGDFPGTARSIAREIGMANPEGAITGPELNAMDEAALRQHIGDIGVFARAVPEQKLRLVNAFKANGDIVAMTGDGVNDAPALKSANIGIAMGERGTDVARESADLVLLDDDFSSIVKAVRMGRRIFDNLKKAVAYIFAIHVPIAGLSLLPVLFRWPLILEPVHIAFLELIIDPACSVVFEAEPEESDIMNRPPRSAGERLFDRRTIVFSVLQGLGVLLILLAIFGVSLHRGQSEADARALTFTTLVIANLCMILTNRSRSRGFLSILRTSNPTAWWVVGATLTFLALALYVPFLRTLFHFSSLHPGDIALCLAMGALSILWFETLKMSDRRWRRAREHRVISRATID